MPTCSAQDVACRAVQVAAPDRGLLRLSTPAEQPGHDARLDVARARHPEPGPAAVAGPDPAVWCGHGLALAAAEHDRGGLAGEVHGCGHRVVDAVLADLERHGQLGRVERQHGLPVEVGEPVAVDGDERRREGVDHHGARDLGQDLREERDRRVDVGEPRPHEQRVAAVSELQHLRGGCLVDVAGAVGRQGSDEGLGHRHGQGRGDGLGRGELELAGTGAKHRLAGEEHRPRGHGRAAQHQHTAARLLVLAGLGQRPVAEQLCGDGGDGGVGAGRVSHGLPRATAMVRWSSGPWTARPQWCRRTGRARARRRRGGRR